MAGLARLEAELKECEDQLNDLHERVYQLQSAPLGSLASASGSQRAPALQMKPRKTLEGHFGKIYGVDWIPVSNFLLSASQDSKLMIWNVETQKRKVAIPLESPWIMSCAASPDSTMVASCGLDDVCTIHTVSDAAGWSERLQTAVLKKHEGYVSCCKFTSTSRNMYTSSGDRSCVYWDIATERPIDVFPAHNADVLTLDVDPTDDNVFVSGATDRVAKLWDRRADTNLPQANFVGHDGDVNAVRFFPAGDAVATGAEHGTCLLLDLKAHKQVQQDAVHRHDPDEEEAGVTRLDFSKSGRFLFAGYEQKQCVAYSTILGDEAQRMDHGKRVSALRVAPSGYGVATGCWDSIIRIWA